MAEIFPKPHAIMIALPYQGHITPFVNLAIKLASKGFVITFVHLEYIHQMLSQSHGEADLFSEARKSGLDIRYMTIHDGFPLEFNRVLNSTEYWESMVRDFPGRVEEFVGKVIQSDPFFAPFLIADTFYTWPAAIAEKCNLLNVSFWTEPALVFSLAYHIDRLKENGHYPYEGHVEEEINYLPGIESISTKHLMSYLKKAEMTNIEYNVVRTAFAEVKKADFILHNTVHELEFQTLSALNKYQPNYAVGPINFSDSLNTNTINKSLWSNSDCTNWLDSKPLGSVLYVSFGSFVQTTNQVIEEIAHGLLLSEVNFIWIVREDTVSYDGTNILPAGYEDEIKDKGLIIPWCDQTKVLSHPAVGGFLTHCGWNSVLESIWCGIPMICYPLTYDQPTNMKLMVDDWKIGINLCDGTSVDRKEVAEKIKKLINAPTSEELKQEVKKVRAKLQNALATDGSSEKNFDQFIEDLKAKLIARNENTSAI